MFPVYSNGVQYFHRHAIFENNVIFCPPIHISKKKALHNNQMFPHPCFLRGEDRKAMCVISLTEKECSQLSPGLHNPFHPTIRDGSTWRTWRCFPVLQLRCAQILRELNQIFIAYLFKGNQEQFFFLQTLLFTAFLVTVLKILTYALVSLLKVPF